MDRLPIELYCRIFSLLDYRHLASSALVCRGWKSSSEQAEIWQHLFMQRWGQLKKRDVFLQHVKSWKHAYEVQDRCDRLGVVPKIVREGPYYYLISKGVILRFLGSANMSPLLEHRTCEMTELGTSMDVPKVDNGRGSSSMREKYAMDQLVDGCNSFSCSPFRRDLVSLLTPTDRCPGEVQAQTKGQHPHVGLFDKLLFFLGDLESAIQLENRNMVAESNRLPPNAVLRYY